MCGSIAVEKTIIAFHYFGIIFGFGEMEDITYIYLL